MSIPSSIPFQRLFELSHPRSEVGQFLLVLLEPLNVRDTLPELLDRECRHPEDRLIVTNGAKNAGHGPNPRPVSYLEVPGNAAVPGKDGVVPDPDTARDARMGDEQGSCLPTTTLWATITRLSILAPF